MDDDNDDPEDYRADRGLGMFSPEWMLKNALMYVPPEHMYMGIIALMDYFESDEIAADIALDVLAQTALRGHYHDPRDFSDQVDADRETSARLSGEDAEETLKRFMEVLNGVPERKDQDDDEKEKHE